MKIAIIGTRGIPNKYGGFEQLTEYLSVMLVQKGHDVSVYNSSLHEFKEEYFKGVRIIVCKDPEDRLGTKGQFIYDLNCIKHTRKQNYDVILQLGYTSSSVWSKFFPKGVKIVTNMDGLEWKRSKYNKATQVFLKQAERWAVKASDELIADSLGIQKYLKEKYKRNSTYIAYGAEVFNDPDDSILKKYNLNKEKYFILIARMEPENNIETIISGYQISNADEPLIIIGSTKNKFGTYLKNKYASEKIKFLESIYNITILNNLRHYSLMYFHGHSVGGTNPSLLEAMASGAFICAHDNIFNKAILENEALYFSHAENIGTIIKESNWKNREEFISKNKTKIQENFSWHLIAEAYNKILTGT